MSNKSYVLLSVLILASVVRVQGSAAAQQPAAAPSQVQAPASDNSQGIPEAVPEDSQSTATPSRKGHAGNQAVAKPADQATEPSETKEKSGKHGKTDNDAPVSSEELKNPVLWHDPGAIGSLDLYYGQGGKRGQPIGPFVFESEDMNGTNPKFDARDANGKKWRVKLGNEARPEVVASRLLWATGYYVNDDYVLESADVQGLRLRRGESLAKNGHITEARFARKPEGQKKIGIWKWKENPFTGTKEFNGLRVMMAVMNNWDLKDVNNAVFEDKKTDQELFLTDDIGATFGTNGLSWTVARSKGNIGTFEGSKFIERETDTEVDFATPKAPTALLIETAGLETKDFAMRAGLDWIGKKVPRQDAKWIGSLLGQLSHQQLVDAFRAGHFPPDEIDAYVQIVESRIHELTAL
jgi:hypothetical protein